MPLYSSATGVSSARWSASVADATAPARIRVTWAGMLSWRSSAGWLMLCVRIVAAGGVWRRRRAVRARRDGIISPSSPRRSRGPARAACAGCPRSATIGAAIPKAGPDDLDSGKWKVVYTTPGWTRSVSVARSTVSPARLWMPTQSPSATPRSSASCGWISSMSSLCHMTLGVRRVCAPTLYCDRILPVVSSSGKRRVLRSSVGTYLVIMKRPLPRTNWSMCMMGVPSGASSLHGHCRLPSRSSLS